MKTATNPPKKFIEYCKRSKIEPTQRQLNKWKRKKGLAYRTYVLTNRNLIQFRKIAEKLLGNTSLA